MNSLDALRRMVANYPGGRPALATRLGNSDEVLRKGGMGNNLHKRPGWQRRGLKSVFWNWPRNYRLRLNGFLNRNYGFSGNAVITRIIALIKQRSALTITCLTEL